MRSLPTYSCHNKAWREHKAEIRGFIAHRSRSASETDDLLQEVFLKALLQGKDFCNLDNPRAWLFHVARNLLVDRLRLTKAQLSLPEDLCAESVPEVDPVDLLSHCLPRVLSELSPEDREVITSCDLQGMTQHAFSRSQGLSLSAAKSRVRRARLRLQAQLVKACQVSFGEDGKVCCFVPRLPLDAAEG